MWLPRSLQVRRQRFIGESNMKPRNWLPRRSSTALLNGMVLTALAVCALWPKPSWSQVDWTKAADEGQSFTLPTTKLVRYGEPWNNRWSTERSMVGAVACSNATFGDPSPGTGKRCEIKDAFGGGPSGIAEAYTIRTRIVPLTLNLKTVAELLVPAGTYVVQAYAFVRNEAGGPFNAVIICSIATGGDNDLAVLMLQPFVSGTNISAGTLALHSVADLGSGGSISMQCYNNVVGGGNAVIDGLRLTASSVGSLSR